MAGKRVPLVNTGGEKAVDEDRSAVCSEWGGCVWEMQMDIVNLAQMEICRSGNNIAS